MVVRRNNQADTTTVITSAEGFQASTLEPNFRWSNCHIICIDISISSGPFVPMKVKIAKHSSSHDILDDLDEDLRAFL